MIWSQRKHKRASSTVVGSSPFERLPLQRPNAELYFFLSSWVGPQPRWPVCPLDPEPPFGRRDAALNFFGDTAGLTRR